MFWYKNIHCILQKTRMDIRKSTCPPALWPTTNKQKNKQTNKKANIDSTYFCSASSFTLNQSVINQMLRDAIVFFILHGTSERLGILEDHKTDSIIFGYIPSLTHHDLMYFTVLLKIFCYVIFSYRTGYFSDENSAEVFWVVIILKLKQKVWIVQVQLTYVAPLFSSEWRPQSWPFF